MRRLEQDESEWEGSLRRASIVHYSRGKQARENANGGAPAARATCWAALGRAVTNVYSGASTTHENDEFMSTFGDCHKKLEEGGPFVLLCPPRNVSILQGAQNVDPFEHDHADQISVLQASFSQTRWSRSTSLTL